MGTPGSPEDRYAATHDWAGTRIREIVAALYPTDAEILDVGAGWGKYRLLLPEYRNVDASEAWQQTVEEEKLTRLYRVVHTQDAGTLHESVVAGYDLVIMGDVLEHLPRAAARRLVRAARSALVAAPYRYRQGAVGGNPYERHLQADLTPTLVRKLYPELELLDVERRGSRPFKGLYGRGRVWVP